LIHKQNHSTVNAKLNSQHQKSFSWPKGAKMSNSTASKKTTSLPSPNARPRRSDAVVSRRIADETILVPIKSTAGELDDIFTLNEVASRVWELADGARTINAIAAVIASEYDVAADNALIDTRELIGMFKQAEVVSFVTGTT
jgi:hypothetical protein